MSTTASDVKRRAYTAKELAAEWGISARAVLRLMDRGELAWLRVGRYRLVLAGEVDRYERENKHHGRAPS